MYSATHKLDVLVVGAGISGIGLGYYLKRDCPDKSFLIFESREAIGGTWDLFKYPGIRSDSDLHTFGYEFKPWRHEKTIADASLILDYLKETTVEYGIDKHIRFEHKVTSVKWQSFTKEWEVAIQRADGEMLTMHARWIFLAAGYYRYEEGFTPKFEGVNSFQGQVIHPQHWPENFDYRDKNVVVVGSGATAVTLIPAMADQTKSITMLQRTPTYIMSLPAKDTVAEILKRVLLDSLAYKYIRRKNILLQRLFWLYCQKFPNAARKYLRSHVAKQLPKDFDVDTHFNPPYRPWDQRLCAVPNGDLFKAIRDGKARVVTDQIQRFVHDGLELKSGKKLKADVVITATGLNVQLMGGIDIYLDDQLVSPGKHITYKGMMLSDIPNLVFAIGYTNSSWTLKVGLLCEHFCRLLNFMDERKLASCTPKIPAHGVSTRPILDFGAGYIQRALSSLPKQGSVDPWVMNMNYFYDEKILRHGPVTDQCLFFESVT